MYVHYYATLMLEYASLYDFSIRSDLKNLYHNVDYKSQNLITPY